MKKKKCHDFILINVEKKQINGTLQKKVLNGIKKMEEKLLNVKNQSIKYVNSVIKNFLPFGIKLYFAPLPAEQKTGFYQEKTMNTEPVNFVKKNLHAINMQKKGLVQKVVQLNPQLLQEVYDIEIEDDHCYYANGFLVSNSNYADSFRYLSQAVSHIETVSGTKGALEKHKIAVESRYRRVF